MPDGLFWKGDTSLGEGLPTSKERNEFRLW